MKDKPKSARKPNSKMVKGMKPVGGKHKPTRKRNGPLPEPTEEQVREYIKRGGIL